MKNGETRSAPRSTKTCCCSAIVAIPPIAEPTRIPTRVGSHVLEPRVVPGLLGGGDGEQDVAVHAPRLLRRDEAPTVEAPHLRRDPHGVLGRVERLDPADPAPARDRRLPRGRRVEPDRRDGSETGDDDTSHGAESVLAERPHDDGQRDLSWSTVGRRPRYGCRVRVRRSSEPVERPADLDPVVPFPPMEAELVRELPEGDEWEYEPKWDGFRGVLENAGGELRLWSRNGRPLLRYFPELRPLGETCCRRARASTARS